MNKRVIYGALIVALAIGLGSFLLKHPAGLESDPFGASPKEASPNCGPEDRYKFDVTINSKDDFISFLKTSDGKILDQHANNWVKLDNFKDSPQGDIDWASVTASIDTERIENRTIYILDYNPLNCSGFTLKMTDDGHVSNYGCCGI